MLLIESTVIGGRHYEKPRAEKRWATFVILPSALVPWRIFLSKESVETKRGGAIELSIGTSAHGDVGAVLLGACTDGDDPPHPRTC